MDFGFSPEVSMIRNAIRDWLNKECKIEVVRELDDNSAYPEKLLSKLAQLGFNGLTVEEKYGGEGRNLPAACLIIMETATRYPALARCYALNALVASITVSTLGNEKQRNKYLPKISKGELTSAIGVDLSNLHGNSTGEKGIKGVWDSSLEKFVLTGSLNNIENADQAETLFLPVQIRINSTRDSEKIVYAALDSKGEGLFIKPFDRLGHKGISSCKVECDRIQAPPDKLLKGNSAYKLDGHSLVWDLLLLASAFESVGLAKGAYNYTIDHAKSRVQFNRQIGRFPAIRRMISDMSKDIQTAEFFSYYAAFKADKGQNFSQESAIAAWDSLEAAQKTVQGGLQIFGGYGYTLEYDIQRYYRDITFLMNSLSGFELLSSKIGGKIGL